MVKILKTAKYNSLGLFPEMVILADDLMNSIPHVGLDFSNDNSFEDALNEVISGTEDYIKLVGDFTHTGTVINLPSDITIELIGSITFANNVQNNSFMFTNSDHTLGNTNICFKGGVLKGNSLNQTTGTTGFFNFVKVTNSSVKAHMQDIATPKGTGEGISIINNLWGYYVKETNCHSNEIINKNYPNLTPVSQKGEFGVQTNIKEVLSDCDENITFTYHSEYDTNDKFIGLKSIKFTPIGNSGSDYGLAKINLPSPTDLSGTNGHLHLLIKLDGNPGTINTKLYSIGVNLYNDLNNYVHAGLGKATHLTDQYHIIDIIVQPGNQNYFSVGSPDLTEINTIGLQIQTQTSQTLTARISRVWTTPAYTKGLFSFTFDGANALMRDHIIPIMEDANLPGVLGVTTNWIENPSFDTLTWSELDKLSKKGWDIVPHTHNHYSHSLNPPCVVMDEIGYSKELLEQHRFSNGSRFSILPFDGGVNSENIDILKKYHLMARTTSNSINTFPYFNRYNMQVNSLVQGSLSTHIAAADTVAAAGGWVQTFGHALDSHQMEGYTINELVNTDFQTLVDHVKSLNNLEVVTYSDVYDKHLNIII